jgi:hypothetical protein
MTESIDYLISVGVDWFDELTSDGVHGFSLKPDSEIPSSLRLVTDATCSAMRRKNDVVAPDAATGLPPTHRRLRDGGYKPICAFGYLGAWICALCVKMGGNFRRDFCGFGVW